MEPYSIPKNCNFDEIIRRGFGRDGSGQKDDTSCTPIINDENFLGIVINAPKKIDIYGPDQGENKTAFPVSGVIAHDLGLDLGGKGYQHLTNLMIIVIIDAHTNEVWHGRIPQMDHRIPPPPPKNGPKKPLTHEEMKGRIIEEVFNPNLLSITNMELRETEYLVYATLGPYKSNVASVQAKKKSAR